MRLDRPIVVALGLALSATAAAQQYPAKSVRVVIPWPAGGYTDVTARIVMQGMSELAGQQFVVDNRSGASGTIGVELVSKAPPDGYTLMVNSSSHVTNPHMFRQLPFDSIKDFVGIGLIAAQSTVFVVHPSLPARSIKELVALARARPDEIRYATSGAGTVSHLAVALFNSMTQTRMVQVPYKGGGPGTTSLLSGETQLLASTTAAVIPHQKANRMRVLAVSSDKRLTALPEVPTIAEAGVPGYEFRGWNALMAPAATPKAIVDRLSADLLRALELPDVKNRMAQYEPWPATQQETAARIRSDFEKYGKLIREIGARAD